MSNVYPKLYDLEKRPEISLNKVYLFDRLNIIYIFRKHSITNPYSMHNAVLEKAKGLNEQNNDALVDVGIGQPIILLNGLFGSLSNWTSVIDNFSDKYRIIIPNLSVFDSPIQDAHLDRLVFLLEQFIERNRLNNVILIGNSLGGHVALLYTIWNPGKVKRLILTGSSGLYEDSLGKTFPRVRDYDFIRERVSHTFHNKSVVTKALVDEVFDTVSSIPKSLRIIGLARSAQRNNLADLLDRIFVPTLLIWGLQDVITPPEVGLQFHSLIPKSELFLIDECGHVPMMEQPELFNAYVSDFLTKQF